MSFMDFVMNFFGFGLFFAGCAALQGALINPQMAITINGSFYLVGIIIYLLTATEMIYCMIK